MPEIPVPNGTVISMKLTPYSAVNCPCLENRGAAATLNRLDQGMIGQNSTTLTLNCPPSSNNWNFTLSWEDHGGTLYWHLIVKYNNTVMYDELLLPSYTNGDLDAPEFNCNMDEPCATNLNVKFKWGLY